MSSPSGSVLYENDEYLIRPAKSTDELRDVWWGFMQVLGWNRGYYDLDSYMNPSRGSGMLLLIEKSSGLPVGHVSAVINDNSTGWASMFIIDEKHRGKGMGRELFRAAEQDFVKHGVEVKGLDGVVEQKSTYERRRFVSSPLGTVRILMRPLTEKEQTAESVLPDGCHVVDIRDVPQNLLAESDLKYTGFARPQLWNDQHMFDRPDVDGVAITSTPTPNEIDDIRAWALNRRCVGGIRIGPVYASDATSARVALSESMKRASSDAIRKVPLPGIAMNDWSKEQIVANATLVTEIWGANEDAVKLFDELGWNGVGVEYYRMWVNGKSTPQWEQGGIAQESVYAIFDAAIG